MPPRSKRKSKRSKKKAPRGGLGFLVGGLLLLAGAGLLALLWLKTPAGDVFLAERGAEGPRERVQQRIEAGVLAAIASLGIPADSVVVRPLSPGGIRSVEIGSPVDLRPLNVALTGRLVDAGGAVHRGERWEANGSAVLELVVGTEGLTTHRILARRGPQAREIVPPPPAVGRLAIVIDDWGHNLGRAARDILELPVPVTLAILPERPLSLRILNEAKRAGKETILHMPMQPTPGAEPGPGPLALEVGMDEAEIHELVERCLDGLPGVEGLNNHMGSYFTENRPGMEAVIDIVSERGLYFLDSLTSPRSVAFDVARKRGVPAQRCDLFIDIDVTEVDRIEERLWRLVRKARSRGSAVGIGHVSPETAEALRRVLTQLEEGDVRPVFLSDLVVGTGPG